MNNQLSKCCGAEINLHQAGGVYGECTKCGNTFDVVETAQGYEPTSTDTDIDIDIEYGLTSIDPNDYSTISRESFLKYYGKAGEKFIADIEKLARIGELVATQAYATTCDEVGEVEVYMFKRMDKLQAELEAND